MWSLPSSVDTVKPFIAKPVTQTKALQLTLTVAVNCDLRLCLIMCINVKLSHASSLWVPPKSQGKFAKLQVSIGSSAHNDF